MKYNKNQIDEILNNPYVLKCSEKNITFTKECKIESVKLWHNWHTNKEIFKLFNFPEYILDSVVPARSVSRWNNLVKIRWENAFWWLAKRWKKLGFKSQKKINNLTKEEKIKYLETEVAYLKEIYKEKHWFYP